MRREHVERYRLYDDAAGDTPLATAQTALDRWRPGLTVRWLMPPEKPVRRISRQARYRLRRRRLRKAARAPGAALRARARTAGPRRLARLLLRDQVMTRQPAITSRFAGQHFPVGSIVAFRDRRGRTIRGKVAELRTHDGLVAAGEDGRYRVPYTALRLISNSH